MNFNVEAGFVSMIGFCIAFDRTHYHNFEKRSIGIVFGCLAVWFSWDKDKTDIGV